MAHTSRACEAEPTRSGRLGGALPISFSFYSGSGRTLELGRSGRNAGAIGASAARYGQDIVPDPLVDPGNPPHRHQACTTAHPTRTHHHMVTLAKSSPSRRAPRPSQNKNATVMLGRDQIKDFQEL